MKVAGNNFNNKKIYFKSKNADNYKYNNKEADTPINSKNASIYIKKKIRQLGGQAGNIVDLTNRKHGQQNTGLTKDEQIYGTIGLVSGGAVAGFEMISETPTFKKNAGAALKNTVEQPSFRNLDLAFGKAITSITKKLPKGMRRGTKNVLLGGKEILFKSAAVGAIFVFAANLFLISTNAFANKSNIPLK